MQAPPPRLYPSLPALAASTSRPYSPTYRNRMMQPFHGGSLFSSFDDPLLQARAAQAAALADIDVKNVLPAMRPDAAMFGYNYLMGAQDHSNLYQMHSTSVSSDIKPGGGAFIPQGLSSSTADGSSFDPSLLIPTSSEQQDSMTSLQQVMAMHQSHYPPFQYPMPVPAFSSVSSSVTSGASSGTVGSSGSNSCATRYPLTAVPSELDTDPRELERFAEHFKQRRIKLGVTQADVGKALAHLRMPGVGSLSQSTICRFESLTLSHNNMVALKPILHSWLEKAEEATKTKDAGGVGDLSGILPNTDKKRKRTSIAAPEKRLLEDYFRQQPRPSGERIAAIADKLDLKKNVVRVWFCNQRQKQKRSALSQFRNSCRNMSVPGVATNLSTNGSNNGSSSGVTSCSSSSLMARGLNPNVVASVASAVAATTKLPGFTTGYFE